MPGIVTDVSAIFVANIIFLPLQGKNAFCYSSGDILANNGHIKKLFEPSYLISMNKSSATDYS
jgi:hypothetical protein